VYVFEEMGERAIAIANSSVGGWFESRMCRGWLQGHLCEVWGLKTWQNWGYAGLMHAQAKSDLYVHAEK